MHWLQQHWHEKTRLRFVTLPFSLIFRFLVGLRRELYLSGFFANRQLLLPVIVVGNITVGGTGKTPLILTLARQLIERGWHPLIISRGYGRTGTKTQPAEKTSTSAQAGDEPLMMAQRDICPVWVGKDRAATANAALQACPECDVVLSDDGLQHYHLYRDIEIAVIDGVAGFGNGYMLPAGPLREPVGRLQTVDAIVINGGDTEAFASLLSDQPEHYAMTLAGTVFYNLLDPDLTATANAFRKPNVHAVAGIGHPQRFFRHLESLDIAFTPHAFPDHHPYLAADLSFADCDAILLTEKDAVKCGAFADARYWVLRIEAQIDPSLTELILREIDPNGQQTA